MKTILAADIGGTKILLQLTDKSGKLLSEQEYSSQKFSSFDLVLAEFLGQDKIKERHIDSACFAVAGPVTGRNATVTNLPWQLNADQLEQQFNITHVHLCNDFEAVGHGIENLAADEIITLHAGEPIESAPRAVIGAGTGLGQALLLPQEQGWQVVATEGGHVDFAPTTRLQISLLEHMMDRFSHVSYERLVSGIGLVTIYEFLRAYKQGYEQDTLRQVMINGDPASVISQFALTHPDSLASEALDLFVQIYGAQAGNLALSTLPRAGLYIAGGIAAKNLSRFQNGLFLDSFMAKGKMRELVDKIPVRLILQPKVGLMGAQLLAQHVIE